jgi:hypothetical protein
MTRRDVNVEELRRDEVTMPGEDALPGDPTLEA